MSVTWGFKWGLLFWHAVSITSFSICAPASSLLQNVLIIWQQTVPQRILFHRASNEFDYALKQAGFFFNACCIFFLGFGTARKVSGILSSALSSLTCRDYDGLLCIWFLDQQPLTLVISQPHPAKHCTALHFIFLQQQWCISLLHMFSLTALICPSLVPVGMCMYMHCISCSRKCQCLVHGHKLEFDVPPVKCFVLPPLSGGMCAHLMCKSGPMLVCNNNTDETNLGSPLSGKKSTCVPELRG